MVKISVIVAVLALAGAFTALLIWGGPLFEGDEGQVNPPPTTPVPTPTPAATREPDTNRPPNFNAGQIGSRSIAEDAPAGTMVGMAISATDPDDDWIRSRLNFESTAEMEAFFEAFDYQKTPEGGRIVVKEDSNLDHETRSFYALRVTVYDGMDERGESETLVACTTDVPTSGCSHWDAHFPITIVVEPGEPLVDVFYRLYVASAPEDSGTIILSADGPYLPGSEVTLTANPAEGFEFREWSGDCVGTGECALTIASDKQITAIFAEESIMESADSIFLSGGQINGQQLLPSHPLVTVTVGETISGTARISVTNDHGSHAVFPVSATTSWGAHRDSYWSIDEWAQAMTVTEYVVPIELTSPVSSGTYAIIFAAAAETSLAHVMSATRWTSGSPRWDNGDDIAAWGPDELDSAIANGFVEANSYPEHGYRFGAAAILVDVSAPKPELTTAATPRQGGTVAPGAVTSYEPGASVRVTAQPNDEYAFYGWVGGCMSSGKSDDGSGYCNVEMNGDRDIVAEFTPFDAPTEFQGTATQTSVTLTWAIVGEFADSFDLIRHEPNTRETELLHMGGDDRSYTDHGLKPGTMYAYELINVDTPLRKSEPAVTIVRTELVGRVQQLNSGSHHVCILDQGGTPQCWGLDDQGQASQPDGERFTTISSGNRFTCALRAGGMPVCWGDDGDGESSPPSGETFTTISAGSGHACALREDGTPVCWGMNHDRYGNLTNQAVPPEDEVFVSIVASGQHSCGLRADGTLRCWGWNAFGQASPPADVDFAYISEGWWHNCSLKEDGSPKCWGLDNRGQSSPPDGHTFVDITTGDVHSCGLKADGGLFVGAATGSGTAACITDRSPRPKESVSSLFPPDTTTPAAWPSTDPSTVGATTATAWPYIQTWAPTG